MLYAKTALVAYLVDRIYGTFKHEFFVDEAFRAYEAQRIEAFAEEMGRYLDGGGAY